MTTIFVDGKTRSPSGFMVPATSYMKLEQRALAMRHVLPALSGKRFALDCQRLVETWLPRERKHELRVEFIEDLPNTAGYTMPGFLCLRLDIYDSMIAGGVYGRSTACHEFAHIDLEHASSIMLQRAFQVTQKHDFCRDSEWQAKAYTASLMMPIEACLLVATPEDLAELCGTSVEAARYRLDTAISKRLLRPTPALQAWHEREVLPFQTKTPRFSR